MSERVLPEYERPPVNEVVCGVLFRPIEQLLAPYLGLLWERFQPDFTKCQEVAPLTPVIEPLEGEPQAELQLSEVPPLPRTWFLSQDEHNIIQVQRDRFLFNWRQLGDVDPYPRYGTVFPDFQAKLGVFREFLGGLDCGDVLPLQFELTYVNHIYMGDGFENLGEFGNVFPDFTWRETERISAQPERVNYRIAYTLPESSGRLHVTIQNVRRTDDNRPLIRLNLTARGISGEKTWEALPGWFNMAHDWIVYTFEDLTSEAFQRDVWRKRT